MHTALFFEIFVFLLKTIYAKTVIVQKNEKVFPFLFRNNKVYIFFREIRKYKILRIDV
jgi:hypothetical protein